MHVTGHRGFLCDTEEHGLPSWGRKDAILRLAMCHSRVTMYSVESTLLGLTWGGERVLPHGPILMSKEYDFVGATCVAERIITNIYIVMINQRP